MRWREKTEGGENAEGLYSCKNEGSRKQESEWQEAGGAGEDKWVNGVGWRQARRHQKAMNNCGLFYIWMPVIPVGTVHTDLEQNGKMNLFIWRFSSQLTIQSALQCMSTFTSSSTNGRVIRTKVSIFSSDRDTLTLTNQWNSNREQLIVQYLIQEHFDM